jgi:penicillin-binding protein 1C
MNISGTRHAGPLLFDLFRALQPGQTRLPSPPALRLASLEVCAVSGARPGPFCPRATSQGIAGVTRLAPCTMHKQIFVDQDTGLRLFGDCLLSRPTREETAVLWPAELVAWRRAQGADLPGLPSLHPDCADVPEEAGPLIQSPSPSTPYVIRADAPARFQRLALSAAPGPGGVAHYWYVNGRFMGQTRPETPCFIAPEPGRHTLSVTDNLGRGASGVFTVEAGLGGPPSAP